MLEKENSRITELLPNRNKILAGLAAFVTATSGASISPMQAEANPISGMEVPQPHLYNPPVNEKDSSYQEALDKYQHDIKKVTSTMFAGDRLIKVPLFNSCPASTQYSPHATWKKTGSRIVARMDLNGAKWCNLVGNSTATVGAEYKNPNSKDFISVGDPTVVATDGLRKQLAYWGYNSKYITTTVPIQGINPKEICSHENSKGTVVRLKVAQKFTPNPQQTIQHNNGQTKKGLNSGFGKSDNMEGSYRLFKTTPKKLCT